MVNIATDLWSRCVDETHIYVVSFIYVIRNEIHFNFPRIIDLCTGAHIEPRKYVPSNILASGAENNDFIHYDIMWFFTRHWLHILLFSITSIDHQPSTTIYNQIARSARCILYAILSSLFLSITQKCIKYNFQI